MVFLNPLYTAAANASKQTENPILKPLALVYDRPPTQPTYNNSQPTSQDRLNDTFVSFEEHVLGTGCSPRRMLAVIYLRGVIFP